MKIGKPTQKVDKQEIRKPLTPVPPGDYVTEIIKVEDRTSKKGDSKFLELTFKLIGDKYSSRRVWTIYTHSHKKQTVTAFSLNNINKLFLATGNSIQASWDMALDKSHTLVGKQVIVKVDVEEGKNGFKDRNIVKGFMAV